MKDRIYIYCIYFPTSNKYYIGQTKNLKRLFGHLRSGSLVCKALLKVNNWIVSILHTCKSRDEANRIEIEEIRNFNCVAPNGYNLTHGGEGGDTISNHPNKEEILNKMSKGMMGKNLGNKHSKETIKIMKLARLGKNLDNQNAKGNKHSKESKKKMGHPGKKNCSYRTETKIKRLKTRLAKLEQGGSV